LTPGLIGSLGVPQGTVTFYDGTSTASPVIGSATYTGGTLTFVTPPTYSLAQGAHTITVSFSDTDNNYINPAPLSVPLSVVPATTQTTFVSSTPSSPSYGQSVNFTFSVVPSPAINASFGSPSGNVQLWLGPVGTGTLLGTGAINAMNNQATILTVAGALPQGNNLTLNGFYVGNSIFATSTATISPFVVGPAATNVGVVANPTSNGAVSGQLITLTATVSSLAGTPSAGTVVFVDSINGTLSGTLTNPSVNVYKLVTSQLTTGTHTITATYNDTADSNYATNFGTLSSYVVKQASSGVTVTATPPASPGSTYGTQVTFTRRSPPRVQAAAIRATAP